MKEFEDWLAENGMLETTIKTYSSEIEQFSKWYSESYGGDLILLYRENVLEYKSFLKNIKTYKGKVIHAKTINKKLSALMSFNSYLVDKGFQDNMVLGKKDFISFQQDSYSPYRIELEEVERLRQNILEAGDYKLYTIVTLMAFAGLRKFEVRNLKTKNVIFDNNELVIYGKRGKFRKIFMNRRVRVALMEYLNRSHRDHDDFIFKTRQSERMSESTINKALGKYTTHHPHKFRHFAGYLLSEGGFKEVEVAQFLGHNSVQTSRKYLAPNIVETKSKIYNL